MYKLRFQWITCLSTIRSLGSYGACFFVNNLNSLGMLEFFLQLHVLGTGLPHRNCEETLECCVFLRDVVLRIGVELADFLECRLEMASI